MGKMNNEDHNAVECLMEYRNHRQDYLPLIDHEKRYFADREPDTGDINIGWDCGFIGKRPYFLECWAPEGLTMITVFVSTTGIEDSTIEELERMLIEADIYSKKEGYRSSEIAPKFCDSNGNEFFSINIVVGINDEPALIDGGGNLSSFGRLNELNGYI